MEPGRWQAGNHHKLDQPRQGFGRRAKPAGSGLIGSDEMTAPRSKRWAKSRTVRL